MGACEGDDTCPECLGSSLKPTKLGQECLVCNCYGPAGHCNHSKYIKHNRDDKAVIVRRFEKGDMVEKLLSICNWTEKTITDRWLQAIVVNPDPLSCDSEDGKVSPDDERNRWRIQVKCTDQAAITESWRECPNQCDLNLDIQRDLTVWECPHCAECPEGCKFEYRDQIKIWWKLQESGKIDSNNRHPDTYCLQCKAKGVDDNLLKKQTLVYSKGNYPPQWTEFRHIRTFKQGQETVRHRPGDKHINHVSYAECTNKETPCSWTAPPKDPKLPENQLSC